MKAIGKVIISMIFLSFSFPAIAQFSAGTFVGLNFGKLTGDAPSGGYYASNHGINTGVMIDIPVSSKVKLSLQPSYSQEGTKVFYSQGRYVDPIDSIQLRLNYFSLPLMVKVQSLNKHFYAVGGLEAGFLSDYKLTSHEQLLSNQLSVAKFNLAAHFGAGYRIFFGYPVLFIELRYTQGLINLTDEPVDKSYIPRVKTNGMKLLIGIELPLSKQEKQ